MGQKKQQLAIQARLNETLPFVGNRVSERCEADVATTVWPFFTFCALCRAVFRQGLTASNLGTFQVHSFQASFFLENPRKPRKKPVIEKNDG